MLHLFEQKMKVLHIKIKLYIHYTKHLSRKNAK